MFRYCLSSILLFSSSLHLTFLIIRLHISFFVVINNRQFGVRPDRTDEVGDRNGRGTRRGEITGMCHIIFCSLLY